jgi:hypothetical protein
MGAWILSGVLTVGLTFLGRRRHLVASAVLLAWGAGTLVGCAGPPSPAPLAPVAIADFGAVAGRWAGPVSGLASRRQDEDWVELTIAPDGTYAFGVARTIGMFGGKGQFMLKDGKLVMEGERGRATFALFEGAGRRRLRGDGVLTSGTAVSADLTPAR